MNQLWRQKLGQCLFAIIGMSSCIVAYAQNTDEKKKQELIAEIKKELASYPNSKGSFDGDKLKISSNVSGFTALDDTSISSVTKCAPISSKMIVSDDTDGILYVYFTEIPKDDSDLGQKEKDGLAACPNEKRVNLYSVYRIPKASLNHYAISRTGFEFGALVVPFKFHLGVNEFSSAPTVAPYVGYSVRTMQNRGLKFTPIFSAGMAFLPITPKEGGTSRSTPAFSTALGVILTSDKNANFNAGLLFGHDFLGKSERNFDRKVGKSWISFYVGYNIN